MLVFLAAVSIGHGVIFECNFITANWYIVDYQYTCYNPTIISDGNLTHVLNVTGNHPPGRNNSDVRAFFINANNHQFTLIPKGLERFFPALLAFGWERGRLSATAAEDLEPFPALQVFDVFYNSLTSLDGDLFRHTPNLGLVTFSLNLLEEVGIGLLDGLHNLTMAAFDGNPCIDMFAETPEAIQELKRRLEYQCSPLTTTTSTTTDISTTIESEQCPMGCVDLIDNLDRENARQDEKIVRQSEEIVIINYINEVQSNEILRLSAENTEQNRQIAAQAGEISELQGNVTVLNNAVEELRQQVRVLMECVMCPN